MNECIQALGKNNNPLVVVSLRPIANSFPPHLQLSLFYVRKEQKKGVDFVRIGKDKYKANHKVAFFFFFFFFWRLNHATCSLLRCVKETRERLMHFQRNCGAATAEKS